MKELDELFELWEKEHEKNNHKRFIRDGIVDEKWWKEEHSIPKPKLFTAMR